MTVDEYIRLGSDRSGLLSLRFPPDAFALESDLLGVLAFLAAVSDGAGSVHPVCAARAWNEWPYQIESLVAENWLVEGPSRALYLTWVAGPINATAFLEIGAEPDGVATEAANESV